MPKNLGLYNNDLSVPRKKDIDELADVVDDKVSKSGDTMTGTLTVGSASLQTNGYVTGTWLKTTANVALSTAPSQIAVLSGGWIYSRTPEQIKSDIGLGNVDNVKQYSASNQPPYPVTSVNGQTGAVTVDLPENLVRYVVVDTNMATLQSVESGDTLYPKTLIAAVQNDAGQTVDQITLLKDNTTAFTPTADYQPATKKYVDENAGANVVVSATPPTGQTTGDYWYEEG